MSAKTNSIRIGTFVLIAIFLFIAGLLAFGAKSYFVTKRTYETAIQGEVSGLSVGSKVLFRGVPIGKVSNIEFAPNLYPESKSQMIVVEFDIDRVLFYRDRTDEEKAQHRQEEIAKGMRAMVKGQGITGTSILAVEHLNPQENPPPEIDYTPRHPYIPSAPGQFTRIVESIERSLRNIQKLDVDSLGVGASNTLAQATRFLEKLNGINLTNTVGKADTLLDDLQVTARDVDSTLKSMKLDTLSGDADQLVLGLKESNTKLQTALDQASVVLDQVGTVPMKDTVEDLRSTIHTLDDVLVELKRYPSGFIFGKPPLPAKSVQSSAR